jgi:hypothetical protein
MASSLLPMERRAGGLPSPTCDNEANLWRTPAVVYMSARTRDSGPPRRVPKLYLPPGSRYFGSRNGRGLNYAACQESGKFRGLFRLLPPKWGQTRRWFGPHSIDARGCPPMAASC